MQRFCLMIGRVILAPARHRRTDRTAVSVTHSALAPLRNSRLKSLVLIFTSAVTRIYSQNIAR